MKKILIIFSIVIVCGAVVFYFIKYSGGGASIELRVPEEEVEIGVPFEVDVIFENGTGNKLGDVKIALDPSEHIVFAEDGSGNIKTIEVGEIAVGNTRKESFRLVALPAENPEYKVKGTVYYSPETLAAEFEKDAEAEVRVKRPDFELSLEAPDKVFSGGGFEVVAKYEKDDEVPELAEFEVHIDFPENFEFSGASPEENSRSINGIRFNNLDEDEGEVKASGSIELSNESEFEVKARLVMKMFNEEYTFVSASKYILVESSPLSINAVLGEHEGPAKPGEELTYVLSYKNNTGSILRNAVIKAVLQGEMFSFSSMESNGRFSSQNNTITWDRGNVSDLGELNINEEGSVFFTIELREKHPTQQLNDKNFVLVVDATIESEPTVDSGGTKTTGRSVLETKVAGLIEVSADGYFRDAKSGIVNGGPFPPKVNQATNYTIHWKLANYGTDLNAVEVRAKLPEGVSFTGKTGGNTDSAPSFDSGTREVVWRVDRMLATTGILSEKPEAIFQVSATPKASDIGGYMVILDETRVTAHDEFVDATITNTAGRVTTRLEADNTVGANDGKVQ